MPWGFLGFLFFLKQDDHLVYLRQLGTFPCCTFRSRDLRILEFFERPGSNGIENHASEISWIGMRTINTDVFQLLGVHISL